MTILALDLGTKFGWAFKDAQGLVTSGNMDFKRRWSESQGMTFLRFRRWLDEMKATVTIDEVAFEEVARHIGTAPAHFWGALFGQLTAWCEEHSIPYRGIPVGTIKRAVTGRGNANKAQMVAAIQAQGYPHVTSEDEADAIGVLIACGRS